MDLINISFLEYFDVENTKPLQIVFSPRDPTCCIGWRVFKMNT